MSDPILIAAVEGGGTSFVVAVAEFSPGNTKNNKIRILSREEIDSSHDNPDQTLKECASFFRKHKSLSNDGYAALGVGMFGPLGCDPLIKEEYGTILSTTPKKNWRGVDVLSPLIEACESESTKRKLAVKIDTDVNAPAVAEYLSERENEQQTKKTISSLAYVTIGTGVGVGLVIHGQPVHGKMHPEGGHVPIQPLQGDTFNGYSWGANSKSPFRGKHTVESMTSSVALTERLEQQLRMQANTSASTANTTLNLNRDCLADLDDDDHEVWDHAANALANLCVTLALVTSVEKIVLGGGIMKRNGLIEKVRRQTRVLLNGYLGDLSDRELLEWITSSSYGSDAGLMGALVLAQRAITEQEEESGGDSVKKLKQTAYNAGIRHGFYLGLSAAYVGLLIYARSGKSSSRR
jgi:fructokinase